MKTIKNLDVTVTYRVGLGDIEVPNDIYEALMNCEAKELNGDKFPLTKDEEKAMSWIADNVTVDDAYEWSYEIEDIE